MSTFSNLKTTPCNSCNGTGRVYDIHALGSRLRAMRKQSGKSLREIADLMGLSVPYLSDVELGRRRATSKIMRAYRELK